MYHAGVPWPAHVFLFDDFSWTSTLVPGGAIGVVLKSKLPNNAAYADNDWFRRAERSKFNVILHCGRSRSHSREGNCGSHVYKPAIRWFLYVRIARSAAFRRWMCGGTN